MEIVKSSWHYFVWSMSYKLFYSGIPKRTNLCRYFWRIVLFTIFLLPVYTLRKLLSIEREKVKDMDIFSDRPFEYYGDYYIKNSIQFISVIGILWAVFLSIPFIFPSMWIVKMYLMFFVCVLGGIVLLGMVVGCTLLSIHCGGRTNIVKEYIKAKKNKICPIIDFKE